MELLFEFFTKGTLDFKKMIGYVFPKEGIPEPNLTDSKWISWMARWNPILSVVLLFGIFFWSRYVPSLKFTSIFCGFIFGGGCILLFFATLPVIFLLFCALILKIRKRSPAIPLILTIVPPLKAFLCVLIITLLAALLTAIIPIKI